MAKLGENSDHVSGDPDNVDIEAVRDWRPSAFYRLLEHEGASGALEAWAAAENARRKPSRPRAPAKDAAKLAEERRIAVRRALGDLWQYVLETGTVQDFIKELESAATKAFGATEEAGGSCEEDVAMCWLLSWDGDTFETKSGAPPTNEMAVLGLEPTYRKVAHQLAQLLGLQTSSQALEECAAPGGKVLTIRPPRTRCGPGGAWRPPFSVSQVLAAA